MLKHIIIICCQRGPVKRRKINVHCIRTTYKPSDGPVERVMGFPDYVSFCTSVKSLLNYLIDFDSIIHLI